MTTQIDSLRTVLESERAELTRAIRSQSPQLTVCEGEHDLVDRIQGMCRRDEAAASLEALARTLAEVNDALVSAQQGSYGTCAGCGGRIAPKRLQTIPWASHCVRCQEALDQRRLNRRAGWPWKGAA